MKKVLSIVLAAMMLLAVVPVTALAVDYISSVTVAFVAPVKGEPAYTDSVMADGQGCYVDSVKWIDADSDVYLTEKDVFEDGEYIVEAVLKAEDGYKFKKAESLEVTVNGLDPDSVDINEDGSLTVTAKFSCGKSSGGEGLQFLGRVFELIKAAFGALVRMIGTMLGLK